MHFAILLFLASLCSAIANLSYNENGRRLLFIVSASKPRAGNTVVPISSLSRRSRPQKTTTDWNPPEYVKAMNDFDDAVFDVNNFLTPKGHNINFIAMLYAIGVLSMHVAQDGWGSYNNAILAKSLEDTAKADPQKAIHTILCNINAAERKIKQLRKIMSNKWIGQVCAAKPSACDSEIYVILKLSKDWKLSRKADILLALGRAGVQYKLLVDNILRWSEQNVQVKDLLDYLRPLVAANAVVHKLIFGNEDKCYQ